MAKLSHVDERGRARMVDVGDKPETRRIARAEGILRLSAKVFRLVRRQEIDKGDVLTVAKLAGIQAAKETARLVPLCHPIPLDAIRVDLSLVPRDRLVRIEATVTTRAATGVEMEALTAVSVAALTVYDMCKGVDRGMTIERVRLLEKSGGRSGPWTMGAADGTERSGVTRGGVKSREAKSQGVKSRGTKSRGPKRRQSEEPGSEGGGTKSRGPKRRQSEEPGSEGGGTKSRGPKRR